MRFSELLFKGNYTDRWQKGKSAWPQYLGSIKMKNFKNITNRANIPSIQTLSTEVLLILFDLDNY